MIGASLEDEAENVLTYEINYHTEMNKYTEENLINENKYGTQWLLNHCSQITYTTERVRLIH